MNDEMAVKIYKALGEANRLQIVKALIPNPHMPCMDLAHDLGIHSKSTLTHHLKILIDAGLLFVRKEGTYRYYSLHREVLEKYAPILLEGEIVTNG